MNVMRSLVVGYGSIGSRHARLLAELGTDVAIVSSRAVEGMPRRYATLREACIRHRPDLVVIANDTHQHAPTLSELADTGHVGTVLVEKPVFDRVAPVASHRFSRLCIAYNLRFHPMLQRLREELRHQSIISAQVYAGQYLPEWRPGTDYRNCYSAHADRGGGVLLDLSHDLDYVGWIIGPWQRVAAIGGRFSPLDITSDDTFALLAQTERCPAVSIQLNYVDRVGRRRILVNTAAHSYEADLVDGLLLIDGKEFQFSVERDSTYRAMHLALLNGDDRHVCSLPEALDALAFVQAARDAADQGKWIER